MAACAKGRSRGSRCRGRGQEPATKVIEYHHRFKALVDRKVVESDEGTPRTATRTNLPLAVHDLYADVLHCFNFLHHIAFDVAIPDFLDYAADTFRDCFLLRMKRDLDA